MINNNNTDETALTMAYSQSSDTRHHDYRDASRSRRSVSAIDVACLEQRYRTYSSGPPEEHE